MYKHTPPDQSTKIPLSRSLLWILISTLFISGTALMGCLYYLHLRERRLQDEQYRIVSLVQTTAHTDRLKTSYLAELLELSLDRPLNLYQFNAKEAEKRLIASPLIKKSTVRKVRPGTLYIHYHLRQPIALIGDYTNTLIDQEGVIFPYRPFFTPKRLTTVYLGLPAEEYQWGDSLKKLETVKLAFQFIQQFNKLKLNQFFLKQLDMGLAEADSYGQRQIVAMLESLSDQGTIYLRLNPDDYLKNLRHFIILNQTLNFNLEKKKNVIMIDLRIPYLAFIKKENLKEKENGK